VGSGVGSDGGSLSSAPQLSPGLQAVLGAEGPGPEAPDQRDVPQTEFHAAGEGPRGPGACLEALSARRARHVEAWVVVVVVLLEHRARHRAHLMFSDWDLRILSQCLSHVIYNSSFRERRKIVFF